MTRAALLSTCLLLAIACGPKAKDPVPTPDPTPTPTPTPVRLSAPSHLLATAGVGSVALTWDAVPAATGYEVLRGPPGGTLQSLSSASEPHFADGTAAPGAASVYAVRATGPSGPSLPSASVTATALPAAPTITAVGGKRWIQVSWAPVPGATGYELSSGPVGGPYTVLESMGATGVRSTVTDTPLGDAVARAYVVRAQAGTVFGPASAEASATTAPPAPASLSAVPGANQIALSWPAATTATEYVVLRGPAGGPYAPLTRVASPGLTDAGLPGGATYSYQVLASSPSGSSDPTPAATATAYSGALPPSQLFATPTDAKVFLSWSALQSPQVRLLRADAGGSNWQTLTTTGQTSFVDAGVQAGSRYQYALQGIAADGAGVPTVFPAVKAMGVLLHGNQTSIDPISGTIVSSFPMLCSNGPPSPVESIRVGSQSYPGSCVATGQAAFPGVPTQIWTFSSLATASRRLYSSARDVDLSQTIGHRFGAWRTQSASASLTLSGMTAWSNSFVTMATPSLAQSDALVLSPTPAAGDTQFSGTATVAARADSLNQDSAWILQWLIQSQTTSPGSVSSVTAATPSPLTVTESAGSLGTLSASLSSMAGLQIVNVKLPQAQFESFRVGPTQANPEASLVVRAHALWADAGFNSQDPMVLFARHTASGDFDDGAYGTQDPFPVAWTRTLQATVDLDVAVQIGASSPTHIVVANRAVQPLSNVPSTGLAPLVAPVVAPMLDGQDALIPEAAHSAAPVLSWSAPRAPAIPTAYEVEVHHVVSSGGTTVDLGPVLICLTASTSLSLDGLAAGTSYVAVIRSLWEPGIDRQVRPNAVAGVQGSAELATAPFTL